MKTHIRLLLIGAAFLLATVPFYLFDIDIRVQNFFFDASQGWKYGSSPAVMFLYNYGTLPGLAAAIAASVVFALGFAYEGMLKYRKISVIVLLTLALGPGLFVNAIFKSYFGRPRPRDVTEFGGKWQHKPPLVPGKPGQGHSFPSGHASMGFLFLALYVYYRGRNRAAAYSWLGGSALFGAAIGAARMAQGGHYFSDVVWAAGFVLLTAEAVNGYVLTAIGAPKTGKKSKVKAYALLGGLCGSAAIFFMMSTPHYEEKTFRPNSAGEKFRFTAETGDITVMTGETAEPVISYKIHGFGMPGSEVVIKQAEEGNITADIKGFFTEVRALYTIIIPVSKGPAHIDVAAGKGDVAVSAPYYLETLKVYSTSGNVETQIEMKRASAVSLLSKKGDVRAVLIEEFGMKNSAAMNVFAPRGKVNFKDESGVFSHLIEKKSEITGSKEILLRPARGPGPELNVKAGKKIHIE